MNNFKKIFLFIFLLISMNFFSGNAPASSPVIGDGGVNFTPEEIEWLKAHPVITLAPDPDFHPIEFIDDQGKYRGISADYAVILEDKLGVELKVVNLKSWKKVLEEAKVRNVDMLGAATKSPQREEYMLFAESHIELPGVILARSGSREDYTMEQLHGLQVAVVAGYIWQEFIENDYPEIDLHLVDDIESGLKEVSLGVVDVFINDIATTSYYIQKTGITNLRIAGETEYFTRLAFASRSDWPILKTILEKALAELSPVEKKSIYEKWVHLDQYGWKLTKEFIAFLAGILLLFAVAGTLLWNWTLKRKITYQTDKIKSQFQAIENAERMLHAVLNTIPNRVFWKDKELNYLGCNLCFAEDAGLDSPEEIVGKNDFDLVWANEAPLYRVDDSSVMERGEAKLYYEEPQTTKEGDLVWLETSKIPLRDLNGNIYGILGTYREITARREAEDELKKARIAAEEAVRIKSDFLSTMTHEMRTPLTAIKGVCTIIREAPLTAAQEDNIRIISNAGDTLLCLVNDILDFVKIEAGVFELEKKPFSPCEAVKSVCDITTVLVKEKGIGFSCDIDKRLPAFLIGDRHRLEQVILNLTANAVKFTEEGYVSLSVSLDESTEPSGDEVNLLFVMKDSGPGIPDSVKEKIFDRFTQGDSSTARRFGGTGLGLSIVKNLVNHMGGDIRVDSEVGKGSTFSFNARFATDKRGAILGPVSSKKISRKECVDKRPLKVLVAEDSEHVLLIILHFLKDFPYKVETAVNGVEALDKFKAAAAESCKDGQEEGYDIVLMDMEMPVMDGYTATKKIREYESEKRLTPTPVIAVTAHALKEHKEKCFDVGCTAHVSKPITKAELIRAIIRNTCGELIERQEEALPADSASTTPIDDGPTATVPKGFKDIVPGFLERAGKSIATLYELLEGEEYEKVRSLAHKMKGEGGSLGLSVIADHCSLIEKKAEVKNAEKIKEGLDALRSYLEEVRIVYD